MITKTNGSLNGVAAEREMAHDWREECLSATLQGHNNGEYDDALVRTVRRFRPDYFSLVLTVDRNLARDFLSKHLADFRAVASVTECYNAGHASPVCRLVARLAKR